MPGKAMLTAKQRTLPKALQEKIIKAKKKKKKKMKYPDIIGSSDKKFRNYSYGKRPGKKLVKYSPVKAKLNTLTSSIKNLSLKKGVMKGVKFAGKAAFSPLH